ncbi:MAG: protein-disulfide reductase DsbD [Proteobacteria bacterium]|nr:protein-disulfide reductase DsbD [Pseudomonadota bacterium]
MTYFFDMKPISTPTPRSKRPLVALATLLLGLLSLAASPVPAADGLQNDFLPPDQAFKVFVQATAPDRIEVSYAVTDGYYLYRDKLKFALAAEVQGVALGQPQMPKGEIKTDDYFGTQEVWHHDFTVQLPVSRAGGPALPLTLNLTWQGCADAGLCYPPQRAKFEVTLPAADSSSKVAVAEAPYVSEQDWLAGLVRSGSLFTLLGMFFLSGLGLAFTPCVLPMVPIISGIIAGHGANMTRLKGFSLSLTYVLGMAATYTAAGMAFAAAGQQAQSLFQQPWIISLFAVLFVTMAASMFGFFTVQMPSFVQTRLAELSNRQRAGSYAGVAVMGALSALIVTTCVGPALVAALSVIGQSGQMLRGGLALFAMAMGMGTPLLVVGASAGQLLPRAGAWMETVKQLFGALLLAVAAWMLARIVPERIALLLWALPALAAAVVLLRATLRSNLPRLLVRTIAAAALLWAVLLVVGGVRGATDPLAPWALAPAHVELPFVTIKSVADLEREVAAAQAAGKPLLLDFYADWCVSCKEMERYTFPDAQVRQVLANTVLLRADVTANDEADQALLAKFGIFGPPTIAFYGSDGIERSTLRVVGYMKAAEFAAVAARATVSP